MSRNLTLSLTLALAMAGVAAAAPARAAGVRDLAPFTYGEVSEPPVPERLSALRNGPTRNLVDLGGARDVIFLIHGAQPVGENPETATEAVLNHLGLLVTYHDVHDGLPDPALSRRARAVVSTASGGNAADPLALASWLRERQAADQPVLLLAGADVLEESAEGIVTPSDVPNQVLADIGVERLAIEEPAGYRLLKAAWPTFEAGAGMGSPFFTPVRRTAPGSEALVQVKGVQNGTEGDGVVVTPRGAYAAETALLFEVNPLKFTVRWRLDPFRFFEQALRTKGLPALDPTTINGRRAFFAHIDGDGFVNLSHEPKPRLAAEVVRDEVLARTWLPTTVSIIAKEIYGRKDREAVARSLYRMPNVQAGVHSWNHPHDWELGLAVAPGTQDDGDDSAGAIKRTFFPTREIDAAVQYVTSLLPPGRQCEIVQWSGKTNPTAPFLARTAALGVSNINGGDSLLHQGLPSVAVVAPYARRVGSYLQVHAASANENLFSNLWTGPFDGQKRALDYYRFTAAPRRLAPVNIYYHFYAAERRAGLGALQLLYDWSVRQPFAHLSANTYARTVEGFYTGQLVAEGPGVWKLSGAGTCRSLRIDNEPRRPDLDASTGIAGWTAVDNHLWIHTAGSEARLVLAEAPPARPRLLEASAQLASWERRLDGLRAVFDAVAPMKVVLAGLPPARPLRIGVDFKGPATAGPDGKATLTAARGRRNLEVSW